MGSDRGSRSCVYAFSSREPVSTSLENALAKGEGIGARAGVEKFNREQSVADGALLPHQLIEPLARHHAFALRIDVGAVVAARRLAVDGHAKPRRLAVGAGAEHQMQVARMETEFY